MSLTRGELELTVAEAAAACVGAYVDRVHDAGDGTVVFDLHSHGRRRHLLLSMRPSFTRVHLTASRGRTGVVPSAFVMLLRARLEGVRVARFDLWGADRVLRLEAAGRAGALVAELTGRHANAFWVEGDDNRIVASLRKNVSELRPLLPGEPYRYPTPSDAASTAPKGPARLSTEAPGRDAEALYAALEADAARAVLLQEGERTLREGQKRLRRREAAIAQDRARAESARGYERLGALLLTGLASARRGDANVRVVDWSVDPPAEVDVPLDPALTPKANAERYFARYRKFKGGLRKVEAQEARVAGDRAVMDVLNGRLVAAKAIGEPHAARVELESLLEEMVERGLRKRARVSESRARDESDEPSAPYRRFLSRDGKVILVGKGARENDRLTFKVARGNDLWLHARDYPGAHVVVPLGRDEEPLAETLLDAATLAAHYSQAKDATVIDVGYARRKLVRKPKGAQPGLVTVSDERTIALRMEPERLERLLRQRGVR